MPPDERENLPDNLKLALNYAEESSKRARWTVFLIQIAALLVLASVWQEASFGWMTQRLQAAQRAVRYLECERGEQHSRDSKTKPENLGIAQKELSDGSKPESLEELDTAYSCAVKPLDVTEKGRAQKYLENWGFSLAQARKNVADLQQAVNTRVLAVGVPVLGIVFDINDLSIVSGITFSILFSWFYFNLRREYKNTKHVFQIAASSKTSADGMETHLKTAYRLLRMTQVLTIPPGKEPDSRDVTRLRQLTRLPSLILWTAAFAQAIVLFEDLLTINDVDYMNPFVTRVETTLASYLFIYVLYRTIRCFQQTRKTARLWIKAWNKICKKDFQIKPAEDGVFHSAVAVWKKYCPQKWQIKARTQSNEGLAEKHSDDAIKFDDAVKSNGHLRMLGGCLLLGLATAAHMAIECWPEFLNAIQSFAKNATSTFWAHMPLILAFGRLLPFVMLILILVVLAAWRGNPENVPRARRLAWAFPFLGLLVVLIHILHLSDSAEKLPIQLSPGDYSAPILVVASLVFLFLVRERPRNHVEELQVDE